MKNTFTLKMLLCQMIAIVSILSIGFITVTPFVSVVDAHPYEFWYHIHYTHCAEWDGQYHTYCGGKKTTKLCWDAPEGHPNNQDDANHNAHGQSARDTVITSSLERVSSCSECTYST